MTRATFAGFCVALALQAQPPRDTRPAAADAPAGTAAIHGTVVSDEAQPKTLRRALVALSSASLPGGRVAITDDEGRFRFTGLRSGPYGLAVSKEGYVGRYYGSSRPAPYGRGAPAGPLNLYIRDGETRSIAMRLPRGAVITGSVTDAEGQPVPAALVLALGDRFDAASGTRRLRPAESATTDDRGVYRIFDLPAGQYVVYAQVSTPFGLQEVKRSTSETRSLIASNIYYPSTPDGDRATRIPIGVGEERTGIDIQVQYVPAATVKGYVSGGANGMVTLFRPNDPQAVAVFVGNAPIASDGQFTFTTVAPGRYEVRTQVLLPPSPARGATERTWMWGRTEVVVDGDDVTNVGIQLMPTFTISGRIAFEGSTPPPTLAAMTLPASIFAPVPTGGPPPAMQVLDGGRFSITGLTPDVYRPSGVLPPRGVQTPIGPWWLKSIAVDGRDVLDAPLDLRQPSENAVVTFSDRASEITGSVKDAAGAPVARGSVVIFSTDRAHWFVNSRRVIAVTPDARGQFSVRNLPPGDYRAAIALDLEQGQWFDPDVLQALLPNALAVTISGTESKTLDLILR